MRATLAVSLGLCAAASTSATLAGCHHDEAAVTADAGSAAPMPTDRLGPGELVEGDVKVLGLPMPVGMIELVRISNSISLRGPAHQQQVASFFQMRVKGGKMYPGVHASDFRSVTAPNNPGRLLDIHVEQEKNGSFTDIVMSDVTPTDAAVLPRDEAMKANGLTPDGKLADPEHMQ